MATLTGATIVSTYPLLLKIKSTGIDGTMRFIQDGDGTDSAFKISTAGATVLGTLTVSADDTGADVRIYSATTNEGLHYDASEDELGLLLTTKLKFHDIGGGEEIFASANGHLEINAGTTLDITAPTVDVNASSELNIDGNVDLNGTLDVSGTSTLGGTLTVNAGAVFNEASADVNFRIEDNTNINAFFVEGGAAAGQPRIGIGTASPSTVLHTVTTDGDNILTVEARNNAQIILHNNSDSIHSTAYDSSIKFLSRPASGDGSAAGWLLGQDHGDAQKFKLSFDSGDPTAPAFETNDYLTVDVSGNVGIGINAPTSALHVYKEMADNGVLSHFEYHTADNAVDANDTIMILEFGDDSSESGTPYFMQFNDSNSIMAHIQWDNNNSAVFTDASDYRIKSNIEPMDGSLPNINKLKPSSFNIREASKKAYGFIAHELAEVYPFMVTGEKDAMKTKVTPAVNAVESVSAKDAVLDGDGNVIEEEVEAVEAVEAVAEKTEEVMDVQSVAYSMLIPFIIKAVQELSASNDALKARIEVLEA